MKNLILILSCVCIANAYQLKFVDNPDALCLDGSQASYYYEKGSGSGSKKYLIYFMGGGWIHGNNEQETLLNAHERSKGRFGTSTHLSKETELNGIFSRDKQYNNEFYNWNSIYINYCDGTGFQGHVDEPIIVNNDKLYFRGELIFKTILATFKEELNQSTQVLLSGCSAGGTASLVWANYVQEQLPQKVNAPDSGIFFEQLQTEDKGVVEEKEEATFQHYYFNFMSITNKKIDPPNKACIKNNPKDKWKCLFAQYAVQYIDMPIFFIQPLYDTWCIKYILKVNCIQNRQLTKCTDEEYVAIEEYRRKTEALIQYRLKMKKTDGAFTPSCLDHCYLEETIFNSDTHEVPGYSSITLAKSLSSWVKNQKGDHQHIDTVYWPNNAPCSGLNGQSEDL